MPNKSRSKGDKDMDMSFDALAILKFIFQNFGGIKKKIEMMVLKKILPYIIIAILVFIGINAILTYIFVQIFT